MQQQTTVVNSPLASALELLRDLNAKGHTARALAADIGADYSTVSRWIAGDREPTGEKLRLLLAWADKLRAAPVAAGAEYERGVRYACEAMAQTLARLLGEQREREDAEIRARALSVTQPVLAGDPAASETPPRRRRRG